MLLEAALCPVHGEQKAYRVFKGFLGKPLKVVLQDKL